MPFDNIINETRGNCLFYGVCYSNNDREKMRRNLFEIGGIAYLNMILLLDAKQKDEFKEEFDFIRARVICGRNQSLLHT